MYILIGYCCWIQNHNNCISMFIHHLYCVVLGNIYTLPWKINGNCKGERGFKAKLFKGKYQAKLEFPEGWGGGGGEVSNQKKMLLWGSMNIFWKNKFNISPSSEFLSMFTGPRLVYSKKSLPTPKAFSVLLRHMSSMAIFWSKASFRQCLVEKSCSGIWYTSCFSLYLAPLESSFGTLPSGRWDMKSLILKTKDCNQSFVNVINVVYTRAKEELPGLSPTASSQQCVSTYNDSYMVYNYL